MIIYLPAPTPEWEVGSLADCELPFRKFSVAEQMKHQNRGMSILVTSFIDRGNHPGQSKLTRIGQICHSKFIDTAPSGHFIGVALNSSCPSGSNSAAVMSCFDDVNAICASVPSRVSLKFTPVSTRLDALRKGSHRFWHLRLSEFRERYISTKTHPSDKSQANHAAQVFIQT